MQNDNILNWSRLWKETTSAVQTETDESVVAQRWNKRWEKRPKNSSGESGDENMRKSAKDTMLFLKENDFSFNSAKVLDIGCGTGALAIPLAREGADVTALDISKTSLERIEETADKEGLLIKTSECSWWTANIDDLCLRKKFDLVIASRTPAVNDSNSFMKMMECSKNICYYSSFLNFSEDKTLLDLSRVLFGKEKPNGEMSNQHHAYNMFFPLMHLYLLGYEPSVKVGGFGINKEISFEKATEMAIHHLGRSEDLSDEKKDMIRSYYKEISAGGMYKMSSRRCHGMMVWKV